MNDSVFLITTRDYKDKTEDFKKVSFDIKNWIKEYFEQGKDEIPEEISIFFDNRRSLKFAESNIDSDKMSHDAFEELILSVIKVYANNEDDFNIDEYLKSCLNEDYYLYEKDGLYIYNDFNKISKVKVELLRQLVKDIRENESSKRIFLILHKSDGWISREHVFKLLGDDKNIEVLFFQHEPYNHCFTKIVKKALCGSSYKEILNEFKIILLSDEMLKLRERKIWGVGIEDYTELSKLCRKVMEEEPIDLAEATESDIREKIKDLVYG